MMQADHGALYTNDLMLCAVGNRALSLVDGFLTLAENDNYLCALPLIRLQLDNSLRSFAVSFVKDCNDFFAHFIDGKPIKDYTSTDGRKLSDSYLVKQMDLKIPGIKKIYKETSSFIHLSDQHLWIIQRNRHHSNDRPFTIGPGTYFTDEEKKRFITVMLSVSQIVKQIIDDWCVIKNQKSGNRPIRSN